MPQPHSFAGRSRSSTKPGSCATPTARQRHPHEAVFGGRRRRKPLQRTGSSRQTTIAAPSALRDPVDLGSDAGAGRRLERQVRARRERRCLGGRRVVAGGRLAKRAGVGRAARVGLAAHTDVFRRRRAAARMELRIGATGFWVTGTCRCRGRRASRSEAGCLSTPESFGTTNYRREVVRTGSGVPRWAVR